MNAILKQINVIPGLVGSMVCDENGHLLAQAFPPIYEAGVIKDMASEMVDVLSGLLDATGGNRMLDIRYVSGRVVIKHLEEGYLLLLCINTINLQYLSLSLNLAVKKLGSLVKSGNKIMPTVVSADELLEIGPLAPTLQQLQAAMAKYLGPMAKIIFVECVEEWLHANQPSAAALPGLIDIVARELNEPDKAAGYRQMVSPYL